MIQGLPHRSGERRQGRKRAAAHRSTQCLRRATCATWKWGRLAACAAFGYRRCLLQTRRLADCPNRPQLTKLPHDRRRPLLSRAPI